VKNLKHQINSWNQKKNGNIFKSKKKLQERMKQTQQLMITSSPSQELVEEEASLMAQIATREKQEEILWR